MIKNLPVGVGDARYVRSIPGSERSPGAGNGNPLQYSRLDKYHELRSLAGTVHEVTKSQVQLSIYSNL